MLAVELWEEFVDKHPECQNAYYDVWAFGSSADELADLTLQGIKTATSSAYDLYAEDNEPLPKAYDYNVILNSTGEPVCVTKTTKVYLMPFNQISERHAYREGEGDRTLDYWRKVHIDFFNQAFADSEAKFNKYSLIVCEEFEVVHKKTSLFQGDDILERS